MTHKLYGFVLTALVEIGVGFVLFMLMWLLLDKLLPFSLRAALQEKRNPAVAIILFSILLGLAIILTSASKSG